MTPKKLRDKQARRKPIMIKKFVIDTIMPIHAHITIAYNSPASSVPVNKPRQKLRISLWDSLLGNFLHRSCIFSFIFLLLTLSSRHQQRTLVQRSSFCPPSWIPISITECMTKTLQLKILSESWDISTMVFVWATWGNSWNLGKSGYQETNISIHILQEDWTIGFVVVCDITISLQRQVALHQLSRTLEWPFLKFLSGE